MMLPCCTSTTTTRTEVPTRSTARLVRNGSGPVLTAEYEVDGREVKGKVRWAETCREVKDNEYMERDVTTTKSDVAGNAFWLGLGAAMGIGSGYMAVESKNKSDTQTCTTDSQGQQSCSSQQSDWRAGAIVLGLGAGAAIIGGVIGLAKSEKSEARDIKPGVHTVVARKNAPCGKLSQLAGTTLELRIPGVGNFEAQVGADGVFALTLPESAEVDPSQRFALVVTEVPDRIRRNLEPDTVVAQVDLTPYAADIKRRRDASLAASDRQDFENVMHGDSQARTAFTMDCTPSGKDVCFDAIDNDCDGLYDVGCGYQTGALQWTLAWRTGDDLDLHVIGPDGDHVFFRNRKGGRAGLTLDIDCLGQFGSNCLAQNVENIFTPRDRAPMEGTYRGWVEVYQAADDTEGGRVIEAMLGGRIAGRAFRMPVTLPAQRFVRVYFAFAIGKDRDKDSVIDREDACPDQPGVFSTITSEQGCPDQDMDGIADKVDACPSEAGIRTTDSKNGCPKKYGRARLTARGVEFDGSIHFATGSAAILQESYPLLKDIAAVMKDHPQRLQLVKVEGHTDSQGERAKNFRLARDRVQSVIDHLVKREKIPGSRFRGLFYGPDRPVASNDNEAGRAKNRRVDFVVEVPAPSAPLSW